jgi:hypothetical protein
VRYARRSVPAVGRARRTAKPCLEPEHVPCRRDDAFAVQSHRLHSDLHQGLGLFRLIGWRLAAEAAVNAVALAALHGEEDVAAYLTAVLEENDPALRAAALGNMVRARGMSQVAKESGIAPHTNPGIKLFDQVVSRALRRSAAFAQPWACARSRNRCTRHTDAALLRPTHGSCAVWRCSLA